MNMPLAKIRALMDRAVSTTFEEEARSCALIAVRLMREHHVTIGPRDEGASRSASRSTPPPSAPDGGPRIVFARYPGCCRACGSDINVGDEIVWRRGNGSWHLACAREGGL